MEPKTCEEYVLAELKAAQAKVDQLQDEKTRIMNELRSELIKVASVKDYATGVIDILKKVLVLQGPDKEGISILSKVDGIVLDVNNPKDLATFIMLAPLFGDDAAREKLQQLAEKKPAATEEEKAAPEDTKNTENKED